MPADAETVTAIHNAVERSTERIEKKIAEVAQNGRSDADKIHERINTHEAKEAGVLYEVTQTLSALQQEIVDHKRVDDREIARLDKLIEKADTDRKGIWKWIMGFSAAGGAGSSILAKIFGVGPTP